MACINISDPKFKEILDRVKNPLLAEIEYMEKYGKIDLVPSFTAEDRTFQKVNNVILRPDLIAEESAIRDLAARLSDRIGGKVNFISDLSIEYSGFNEGSYSVINLAKATLDTPIHEIVGHPLIRAIKESKELKNLDNFIEYSPYNYGTKENPKFKFELSFIENKDLQEKVKHLFDNKYDDEYNRYYYVKEFNSKEDAINFARNLKKQLENSTNLLYQNLLKELETGYGKEVFERVKENYVYKNSSKKVQEELDYLIQKQNESTSNLYYEEGTESYDSALYEEQYLDYASSIVIPIEEKIQELKYRLNQKYTIEDQQEEALVQLLGELTAGKIKETKENKNLITLLKQLLKEMTDYMRSLFSSKEIKIEDLKADMTLNDLSNLLAYTDSKIIIPGSSVEYTTPDGEKFATYKEASRHISKLFKENKDVDLSDVSLQKVRKIELPDSFGHEIDKAVIYKEGDQWFYEQEDFLIRISEQEAIGYYLSSEIGKSETVQSVLDYDKSIVSFIERNKEFEQSKEIIETWKKENNIKYNPEEVYSRGQGFYSAIGAYSSLELDLLLQNLLQHIEDNKKAGGKFAISAYTKPIEKRIGHLEGDASVRFVIYPKSENILWAAPTDVNSGSVWDASEKVSKNKKSELLGVSHSKYPSLSNVYEVSPNLADIIDKRSHHHNELGIELTNTNFRLEYDESVPLNIKKLVNSINSILDQRYGKLSKTNIFKIDERELFNKITNFEVAGYRRGVESKIYIKKEDGWYEKKFYKGEVVEIKKNYEEVFKIFKDSTDTSKLIEGIQPTKTRDNTINIENIVTKLIKYSSGVLTPKKEFTEVSQEEYIEAVTNGKKGYELGTESFGFSETFEYNGFIYTQIDYDPSKEMYAGEDEYKSGEVYGKIKIDKKEYTDQALINTKVARLKEVAKKYPRSLISSKVVNTTISSKQYQKLAPNVFKATTPLTVKDFLNEIEEKETKDKCALVLKYDNFDLPF
jgi:hypothetical protein